MIIYRITLPREQDTEAFTTFMRDEYFPGVRKGPTRVGQVTTLALEMREDNRKDREHEFLLRIGWNGVTTVSVGLDTEETLTRRLSAFEAKVLHVGTFDQVASWNNRP